MKHPKISTLQEVADKAKVSRMTVSRVFSGKNNVAEETSKKIKKIANKIGYHPNLIARSLSNRNSQTIGVFIPKTRHLFLDIYIAQILSGISDVTQESNYRILLFPIDPANQPSDFYLSIAKSHLVDGIILLKTKIYDKGVEDLGNSKFPFILVNHRRKSKIYNFVDTRNSKGSMLAIEYLYNLGHRKIAFVTGSMDETNAIDRLRGYKSALKSYGLPFRKEWIIDGDFSREKAYESSKELLDSKNLPTAIFCSDDYMAIGLIDRIKEMELSVPKDISIVGFDDIEISSYISPSLTTIRQPIYEIGQISAKILFDLINKKRRAPIQKYLDVDLIIRESATIPK